MAGPAVLRCGAGEQTCGGRCSVALDLSGTEGCAVKWPGQGWFGLGVLTWPAESSKSTQLSGVCEVVQGADKAAQPAAAGTLVVGGCSWRQRSGGRAQAAGTSAHVRPTCCSAASCAVVVG